MRRFPLSPLKTSPPRIWGARMLRSPQRRTPRRRRRRASPKSRPKLGNAPPRCSSRHNLSMRPVRLCGTSLPNIAGCGTSRRATLKLSAISTNIFCSYSRTEKRPVRKFQSFIVCIRLAPCLLELLAILAVPSVARAQAPPPPAPPAPLYPPGNEFAVWGGYSLGNSHVFGVESNRQLGELALRYARTLYDKPSS